MSATTNPTRPTLRGSFGMVASTHWLASAAGLAALERGGNAFDAAVTTGFVLQVVEPHLNGPGGEVPVIFHDAAAEETAVVCGQGVAPAAATAGGLRALGLDLIPGTGLLPACVPGAFGGWMRLAERGRLPLRDLLAPAIGYAERGYVVLPGISAAIASAEHLMREDWSGSAAVYLPDGAVPAPGAVLRNPRLAETYRRVVHEAEAASGDRDRQIEAAVDIFYQGFVADAIDAFVATTPALDAQGDRHKGLLSGDDLARWRATIEPAATFDYGPYTIHKTGPWGQGPAMLQQLALLAGFDLDGMDPLGPDLVHTVVECAKLAFADREAWYGDPLQVDVPLDDLLDPAYTDARRALAGAVASLDVRPGSPGGRQPYLARATSATDPGAGGGEPTFGSSGPPLGDTCHLDVMDADGNLVSATPSGGWLMSSPVIPALGFCLGTRGQMFWLDKSHPNSLAPGKRPRTTLSPTLAKRDGEPWLAFGTPGGDQQDQWPLTFLLRHVHGGLDLQAAIDAPTFHTTHFPSSFHPRDAHPGEVAIESRFPEATMTELQARGHRLNQVGPWSLGRVTAVGRDPATGLLQGAADARGSQAYAVGR
jgi:gamma-glutamyltranspeptidase / glutathione hydrolase